MHAIPNPKWEGVVSYTWADLSLHQWECFRIALFETVTEQVAVGVKIDMSNAAMVVVPESKITGVLILQSPVIMQSKTEMITSIVVSERDYKTEMIKSLPLYERKSGVINEVVISYDREFRNVEQQLEVVDRNIFIDTAVESLPIFERDLGIKTEPTLRYDQRREQISSRNRASFDQTTEQTIKNVASAYGNGEVEVLPADEVGVYEIKFIGIGIPNNMEGLKKAIDIIIPAHLGIKYIFTFSPWESIKDLTWGGVIAETWNDLRTWDEVS